jgi:MtN3 and saliva related transmembrane protein
LLSKNAVILELLRAGTADFAGSLERLGLERFRETGRVGEGALSTPEIAINAVGVAAAGCSMASFIPQAIKIIKERDASSVSARMYVVTIVGFSLWTVEGVLLKSWPLVGSNIVSLVLSSWILGLKIWLPSPRGPNR